ncbi:MAG: hypothetical protein JOZ17_14850 [Acetobacteraceae bacterium]|nr:hypothetical protein [Acetobacteraceae bacterium]
MSTAMLGAAGTSAAQSADSSVEERHLNILRQIALAGGLVAPDRDPNANRGYTYSKLGDDVDDDLAILARRNYLEPRFFDRVSLCPKCGSHHLNVREICPGCRRAHLTAEGLLHHFRCGYVGVPSEYQESEDGSYRCPKCNRWMHHLGTQYDRLGKAFTCYVCGLISETPPVEAVCFACDAHTAAENLVSAPVFSYALTSSGAAAIQRGSLLDSSADLVTIADGPAYRRSLILEFLEQETKRLRLFKRTFSILVVRFNPVLADQIGESSPQQWLGRLRGCLRDVDLLGQLAEAVYLVVLPETQRRAADAIRERILTECGPQAPFSVSTVEVTKPVHLTEAIGRLTGRRQP